nr:uncharacterized protein LOC129277164 [Lytechinus pictus]
MDDSDMEILGIPLNKGNTDAKQTLENNSQSSKSTKKCVEDKLKETERFHHHTAASKSSHSKKKRRKSNAERNKKKSRHEKSNKMEFPMLSDPHRPVPLITQNRITTSVGIYNKAKKSDKVLRDFIIPDAVRVKTQESLQKILDVSEANLPPAPNLDSPLILDDMAIGLVQVVQSASPVPCIQASKPVTVAPAPKPIAAIYSHADNNEGLSCHRGRSTDEHITHTRSFVPHVNTSTELSPISEAAEMIQSSFNLNSVFHGRDYFAEIKDSLLKQLHRQRQSSALKTPRKSHIPSRHHSSVRKNLTKEFDRKSGSVKSCRLASESSVQQSDIVRRSDLIPKSKSPSGLEPTRPHITRGLSSLTVSTAPHTIAAPPSDMIQVNAFEECARTLQHQPTVDISVDEFFPRVETQMLHGAHTVDILDSIQLSCSSNSDSFSYSDPHHMEGTVIPTSSLIYPPHLDPTLPFQEAERYAMTAKKHHSQHGMVVLKKGKYEPYEEDSPEYSFPLPPPPVLPPSSPSPPKMFRRQRMY